MTPEKIPDIETAPSSFKNLFSLWLEIVRNENNRYRHLQCAVFLFVGVALWLLPAKMSAQSLAPGFSSPPASPFYSAPPTASLGSPIQPLWDPYATGGYPAATSPAVPPPPVASPGFGAAPGAGYPGSPPTYFQQPTPGYPPPNAAQPLYGQPPPGGAPPYGESYFFGPGKIFSATPNGPYMRFFQNIRLDATWLEGDSGTDLNILDAELAATAAFPNFFYRPEPLLVTPGFAAHFWGGPQTIGTTTAVLPSRAYSAYLDLGWNPQVTPQFSGELNFRVGVYSDFQAVNADSIRLMGRGLGVLRITPTLAAKLGIVYLDRVNIKMLPAGGLLWEPNPQTRFDIFFPQPKLAQYLTTLGNTDVWWYVGGEYGGGSWTIQQAGGLNERIDINDLRVFLGFEWTNVSNIRGFFEVGYAFEREVKFLRVPVDNFDPDGTVMLRIGANY